MIERTMQHWHSSLAILLALGLATAVATAGPPRGTAQSTEVRVTGELHFDEESLHVGEARIPWDRLLTVAMESPRRTLPGPHVVRLVGGQRWRGHVASLEDDVLQIEIPELGTLALPTAAVTAIDFQLDLPWPPDRPGMLERRAGGPVPARLLAIDEQMLAVDSPLGELKLPRAAARRYVFAAAEPPAGALADEVVLIGGSVLHGAVAPGPDGVVIEHDRLGQRKLAWTLVRSLRRRSASWIYLADLEPTQVRAQALLADAMPVEVFHRSVNLPGALDAWMLQPKLLLAYTLPERPTRLRATLAPAPGAEGIVLVRVLAGGDVVWDGRWEPAGEPQTLSLDLGAAERLMFQVDYGDPVRFPLGVHLLDPLLLIGGLP